MREKRAEIRADSRSARTGHAIAELAGRQYGVIARAQLRELGLDRKAVARRVSVGILHPHHGGRVFATSRARLSKPGMYLAAVLACAPGAALSGRSAADLWGLRPNALHLEVSVPQEGGPVPGVTVHRTRMLDRRDFTVERGIPVTSVARTLLDLSAVVRQDELMRAIDRAERAGLFDLDAVADVLERARGRKGTGTLRRAVAAYRISNQKSELERRFRRLLQTAPDIPAPSFNALIEGETATHEVDAWWPDRKLAVQTDGFEFHRTRQDRERDGASDADLELAGLRVMRLTWDDVTVHGERTFRRIRLARS